MAPDKPEGRQRPRKADVAGVSSRASHRVAVLMGGPSAEREVSLVSGRDCATALRVAGYEVVERRVRHRE